MELRCLHFVTESPFDLRGGSCLEEQIQRLLQVAARFVHGRALAGYIQLGAE